MSIINPRVNPLAVTGGYGASRLETTYTFANFNGTATLFTVTGDVTTRIYAVCDTNLTSAGAASISLGVVGDVAGIIPVTLATALIAREIWVDATPTTEVEDEGNVPNVFISDGNDIVMDTGGLQVDTGVMDFVIFWTPISAGSTIVVT
jgi:hypothetical protein